MYQSSKDTDLLIQYLRLSNLTQEDVKAILIILGNSENDHRMMERLHALWEEDPNRVLSLEELQEQWRARGESYLLSRVDGVVDNRHRDVPQVPKTFESVGEYTQEVFGPLLDTAAEVEKEIVEQAFFQGVRVEWKLRDGEKERERGYGTVPVS